MQFGRYEALQRLGAGGMGEVFLARLAGPAGFEKRVVVKALLPRIARDAAFIEMFLDEARLAAQLCHPNIAQIFELGQAVDGTFYMAMEYVPGSPLDTLMSGLPAPAALPISVACSITLGVLAALEYAHAARDVDGRPLRIVHRDISTANIMLTPSGDVKLLDFGIARARSNVRKTEPGIMMGKYGFVSPEQCLGRDVDHRSDLFSVGAVLYQLATGAPLYDQTDRHAAIRAAAAGLYRPPREVCPDLPEDVAMVLSTALALDAGRRYQSAAEMRHAVEALCSARHLVPGPTVVARWLAQRHPQTPVSADANIFGRETAEPGPASSETVPAKGSSARAAPRRRWPRAALSVGAALALVASGVVTRWVMRPLEAAPPSPVKSASFDAPPPAVSPSPLAPALVASAPVRAVDPPQASSAQPPPPAPPRAQRFARARAPRSAGLESRVSALRGDYELLVNAVGVDGLTGLERESFRLAQDAYERAKRGEEDRVAAATAITHAREVLEAGISRRGLRASAERAP